MVEPIYGSVLLSDQIEKYAMDNSVKLIDPFNRSNLKPASYKLTIGDECSIGGKYKKLQKCDNKIIIPPFEVVIIKTKEEINMPSFLIARWNIKVSLAYQGLLWVGGPQVDPGYKGNLFCPIYNLSDQEVMLEMGESIATIDFIRTTFLSNECVTFEQKRFNFKDYNYKLKSALFTNVGQRLDKVEKGVEKYTSLFVTALGLLFTALVINISFLAVLISSSKVSELKTYSWLVYICLALSIFAIAVSIASAVYKLRVYTSRVGYLKLMFFLLLILFLFVEVEFPGLLKQMFIQ